MQRRDFLSAQLTLATATVLPFTANAAQAGKKVFLLYDRRINAPLLWRQLKASFEHSTAAEYDGDITALWQVSLKPLWAQQQQTTIGLTRHTEFFLLRTLAREQGYSVLSSEAAADHVMWQLACT